MKSNANFARIRLNADLYIAIFVFAASFALYLRTMPPTVLDGDSGEYQYMAYILGVPHSTGYPLYILLGKLFTLIPVGDVAYRINLFSVVFAALSAPLIFWTARRMMPRTPAFLATLIFAVTPSMWGSAIQAKTYALHLFLGVLTVLLALRWHQDGNRRDFYWFALVCGLDLTNHIIIRFIAPALLLLLWLNRARLDRAMLVRGILLGILPLFLYAYIPIRANQLIAQQDPANKLLYGREDAMVKGTVTAYYNNSPQGVFGLITGLDNKYKLDVKSPLDQMNRVELSSTLLIQQFGPIGLVLALVGAWGSFRRDRGIFLFLLAVAACIGLVSLYLKGISTVYYFSLTYFVLALWIGLGIDVLLQSVRSVQRTNTSRALSLLGSESALTLVLLLLPTGAVFVNYSRLDESNNYAARDYAQAVLREPLPPNSVVIAPWEVSQPIRYFQFVENQRPDLLVTNVSPIWPQFQKLLATARDLHRPFYNVEFNPELATDPGPRFVQAIPLPLLGEPHPRYPVSNMQIVNGAQVIGYDLDPDPPQPGKPVRILIYYRTTARMYPMYSSMLTVTDITGRLWGDHFGFPGSQYYPTYQWQAGDVYLEAWQFIWPGDAPAGLYSLDLGWYVYNLDTHKSDYDHENKVALGAIRAGDLTATTIGNVKNSKVGDSISLLGWDSPGGSGPDSISVARGEQLTLDLYWRADSPVGEAYTVFVHLIDDSGQVKANADSPPSSGLYPTNHWVVGENIRDRHSLAIPAQLAPGNYSIEIGMYLPSTGIRLPIGAENRLLLTHVRVK